MTKVKDRDLMDIFESMTDGLLIVASNGKVLYSNRRIAEMWYIPEELMYQSTGGAWVKFILEQLVDSNNPSVKVEPMYRSSVPEYGTVLFHDGRIIERYSKPWMNGDEIGGRVWILRDITERMRIERALRSEINDAIGLYESLTYPLYIINADDYTIDSANAAAKRLTSNGQLTCFALTHGEATPCQRSNYPCPMEMVKISKQPRVMEHLHDKEGDDGQRIVEVRSIPILDHSGDVRQVIVYLVDISERRLLEAVLRGCEERFRNAFDNPHIGRCLLETTLDFLQPECERNAVEVLRVAELNGSMVLDEDVFNMNGMLLAKRGKGTTFPLIERLHNYAMGIGVAQPFRVLVRAQDSLYPTA